MIHFSQPQTNDSRASSFLETNDTDKEICIQVLIYQLEQFYVSTVLRKQFVELFVFTQVLFLVPLCSCLCRTCEHALRVKANKSVALGISEQTPNMSKHLFSNQFNPLVLQDYSHIFCFVHSDCISNSVS